MEALKLFKRKSAECLQSVSEHNLNIYGDFVLRTFMQHYKLYQFVYLNERERNVINTTIQVRRSRSVVRGRQVFLDKCSKNIA